MLSVPNSALMTSSGVRQASWQRTGGESLR
jgi:hypothetical protein